MCLGIQPIGSGENAFFLHVATLLGRMVDPKMEARGKLTGFKGGDILSRNMIHRHVNQDREFPQWYAKFNDGKNLTILSDPTEELYDAVLTLNSAWKCMTSSWSRFKISQKSVFTIFILDARWRDDAVLL